MSSPTSLSPVIRGRELRFAVGGPTEPRSAVWKFFANKDDLYVSPRMFGSDAKVSLHASGQAQWSLTSEWVLRDTSRRNADRHMKRWLSPPHVTGKATPLFSLRFSILDLRRMGGDEDVAEVHWLKANSDAPAVALECFRIDAGEVTPGISRQRAVLASLPMASGHSVAILFNPNIALPQNLDAVRTHMRDLATASGLVPSPAYRAALFVEEEGYVPAIVEVSLF